ncbi:MAG: helix-turn-helix transcriptional regulator [Myxococcaceae bacterium]|nr:helix-turn-helix transcriptional regulator [Myxococcaceae bacterium]
MSPGPTIRQRIVDTAAAFRRQGRPLSMKELAHAAGVSRASLYRQVGGREELDALLLKQGIAREASTRERLIEQAMALIAEHGPGGFSLEMLAGRAKVSPSTVYREFNDRDGLLREVIRRVGPPVTLIRLLDDPEAPLETALVQLVEAMCQRIESNPFILTLLMHRTPGPLRELRALRRAEESVSAALRRYLAAQMKRGRLVPQPVEVLTQALIGQVLSLVLAGRIGGELAAPGTLRERATALVTLFLHGAAVRGRSRSR